MDSARQLCSTSTLWSNHVIDLTYCNWSPDVDSHVFSKSSIYCHIVSFYSTVQCLELQPSINDIFIDTCSVTFTVSVAIWQWYICSLFIALSQCSFAYTSHYFPRYHLVNFHMHTHSGYTCMQRRYIFMEPTKRANNLVSIIYKKGKRQREYSMSYNCNHSKLSSTKGVQSNEYRTLIEYICFKRNSSI